MALQDLVVNKVNIVDYISHHTELKTRDYKEWRGCCPIHMGTNDSSFRVKPPEFRCFACQAEGNVISFVSELEKIDYFQAVEKLAEEANIPITDEKYIKLKSVTQEKLEASQKYVRNLPKVYDYLHKERGFNPQTIAEFEFGADENCVTIPVRDNYNRMVSITKRFLDGRRGKYKNETNSDVYEKGATLYNFSRIRKQITNFIYVAEGYLDAASAWQQKLPCVAYCGSEITREQIEIISKAANDAGFVVYLAADNDEEGQKRVPRMRDKFRQHAPNITVRVVKFPAGIKDFNDMLVKHLDISLLPTENIDLYVLKMKLDTAISPDQEYVMVEQFIKSVPNPMIRSDISRYLSERWKQPLEQVNVFLNTSDIDGDDTILQEFKGPEEALAQYRDVVKHGKVPSGFPTLDKITNFSRKSEPVLITAYPGVAKTALACEMAMSQAIRDKLNVVFFSMEMLAGQLYERMIASFLGIPLRQVEEMVKANDPSVLKIKEALDRHLYIVDTNYLSLDDIRRRITVASNRVFDSPVDVVYVDYLQYMKGVHDYEHLSATIKAFKALAKDLMITPYILSQLNRSGNQWTKPTMNMIRGAGDIEASADTIYGLWLPGKDPGISLKEQVMLEGDIMLGVLKHRRGVTADELRLHLDINTSRIREKI